MSLLAFDVFFVPPVLTLNFADKPIVGRNRPEGGSQFVVSIFHAMNSAPRVADE